MPSLGIRVLADNNTILDSFLFYPGEDREMRLQIVEDETDQQYLIPDFPIPTLTLFLPGSPTNVQIANSAITIDSRNRSIVSTIIPDVTTLQMTSGNIRLVIDSGSIASTPDLSLYTVSGSALITVNGVNYSFTGDGSSTGTFQLGSGASVLLRGDIGTISDGVNPNIANVVIDSITKNGSNYQVQGRVITVLTRMAQAKNVLKRATPNPT